MTIIQIYCASMTPGLLGSFIMLMSLRIASNFRDYNMNLPAIIDIIIIIIIMNVT